jgi:hypothetical protein
MNSLRTEKLQRAHAVEGVDRGRGALNQFLTRYAYQHQQAGASTTYVALSEKADVIGYYTLVVAEV